MSVENTFIATLSAVPTLTKCCHANTQPIQGDFLYSPDLMLFTIIHIIYDQLIEMFSPSFLHIFTSNMSLFISD